MTRLAPILIITLLLLTACGGGTGDVLSPATLTATAATVCPDGTCPPPATPAPVRFVPEAAATMTAAAASWQTAEPWMTPPPPLATATATPLSPSEARATWQAPATMTAVYDSMAARATEAAAP